MTDKVYKVLVAEDLFVELGGDRVDWGRRDRDGFYSPTVFRDDAALGSWLHAAAHPSHSLAACPTPEAVPKMVDRFRAARGV